MNDVERLLSDTADYFEQQLVQRPTARTELASLLAADQQPQVMRKLQGPGELFIAAASTGAVLKILGC